MESTRSIIEHFGQVVRHGWSGWVLVGAILLVDDGAFRDGERVDWLTAIGAGILIGNSMYLIHRALPMHVVSVATLVGRKGIHQVFLASVQGQGASTLRDRITEAEAALARIAIEQWVRSSRGASGAALAKALTGWADHVHALLCSAWLLLGMQFWWFDWRFFLLGTTFLLGGVVANVRLVRHFTHPDVLRASREHPRRVHVQS
ncbi:MAG: hypothetical protein H6809_01305 [Phycisphaeraceae bacterium]|nr:hypothetical protein [Phycisphaeraceae bacterium]